MKHLNFLFKNLKFSFFNISAHSFLRSCDRSDFIPQIGSPTQPSHHVMFHLPRSCVTSIEIRPFLRALLLAPLFKLHFRHPIVFYTFRATPQRNQRVFSFRMIPWTNSKTQYCVSYADFKPQNWSSPAGTSNLTSVSRPARVTGVRKGPIYNLHRLCHK